MLMKPQLTYTITATSAMRNLFNTKIIVEKFSQTGSLEREDRIIGSRDS